MGADYIAVRTADSFSNGIIMNTIYTENLKGRKFGDLKVIDDQGFWCICCCRCGTVDRFRRDRLTRGLLDSCGHCSNPSVGSELGDIGEKKAKKIYGSSGHPPPKPPQKKRRKRRPSINITGKSFGLLTVEKQWQDEKGIYRCLCRCECGAQKIIRKGNLIAGSTSTCGRRECREIMKQRIKK